MKIIQEGHIELFDPLYRFHCGKCNCIWDCFRSECEEVETPNDFGILPAVDYVYKYNCPYCDTLITGQKLEYYAYNKEDPPPCKGCPQTERVGCPGCSEYKMWAERIKNENNTRR